jgi:excisionase family DNA binding protein
MNDVLEASLPRTIHPPRRFTSVEGAATYADVSQRTIWRWIHRGILPAHRVGPRLVKIDVNDLDALAKRVPTAGGSDAA